MAVLFAIQAIAIKREKMFSGLQRDSNPWSHDHTFISLSYGKVEGAICS